MFYKSYTNFKYFDFLKENLFILDKEKDFMEY